MTTPEQLAKYRKAAESVWMAEGRTHWVNMSGFDNYLAGYIRAKQEAEQALTTITADDVTDEMVEAYLTAQRATVEEADRSWGRAPGGGLYTNTIKAACRSGLIAALSQIKHRSES